MIYAHTWKVWAGSCHPCFLTITAPVHTPTQQHKPERKRVLNKFFLSDSFQREPNKRMSIFYSISLSLNSHFQKDFFFFWFFTKKNRKINKWKRNEKEEKKNPVLKKAQWVERDREVEPVRNRRNDKNKHLGLKSVDALDRLIWLYVNLCYCLWEYLGMLWSKKGGCYI